MWGHPTIGMFPGNEVASLPIQHFICICILLYLYLYHTVRQEHPLLGLSPEDDFAIQHCICICMFLFEFTLYLYHTATREHPLLGMFLLGATSLLLQYSRGTALPSEPRIFSEDNTCAFVQRRCCRNCTFSVSCRVRLQCSSSSCVPDCPAH